ncbi:MAG: tRNA (adenosine(37)-N6)-threonylcarbamoyltransferase complex ATPase subunit type 1 TsaE [Leptospirales bacterium]
MIKTEYKISAMQDWNITANSILTQTTTPAIFLLTGHLGVGKTTFVQAAAKQLEIKERIHSPTFNIMNDYTGRFQEKSIKVFHIDCYRMTSTDPLLELDFFDLTDLPFFAFVEWPEKTGQNWTDWGVPVYTIAITTGEIPTRRNVTFTTGQFHEE